MLLSLVLSFAVQAATDPRAAWERFPVFVWTTSAKPVEVVGEFGGACVQRMADTAWLDEKGLDWLVFNGPGRDDLHLDRENARYQERWKRWYDSRDPKLLVREPCVSDPATRERLKRLLDESLTARGGRTGLGVSLGDEIGLTPGGAPEDVCQCAHCERAWKEFRAARGLAQDVKLADISTAATLSELDDGETAAIGPWLLRREFHEQQWTDLIAELARRVREKSPGTPVGLLGLTAQSAFGSVAIESVLPSLDFIECYRVGNARELAFTLRRPEQRVLLTIFDDARGPDFVAWQAWEHWMRGGDGLVIWSEKELVAKPALRQRLARAVRDIRAVQKQIGRFRPEPQGVAVVHSQPSVAVSWLRDAEDDGKTWPRRFPSYQEQHGELELSRKRWFEFLEDNNGAMPGALPLGHVDADTAKRFPLLVLDRLLVLDDVDVERLKRFMAAGGSLIPRAEIGWVDTNGRSAVEGFKQLRESPSSRLLAAPRRLNEYEGQRDLLKELGMWPEPMRFETAPFGVTGDAGEMWRWISTWMETPDGLACAVLPKPQRYTDEQEALALPSEIKIGTGNSRWRIEWIHPKPDEKGVVRLPAGDAAVFRLHEREKR